MAGKCHTEGQGDVVEAFFALLKAGLWGRGIRLAHLGADGFGEVCRIAAEQSVCGLVAEGLELLEGIDVSELDTTSLLTSLIVMERRNEEMNALVGRLVRRLESCSVRPVLVKGQGVAQCYGKPLWRMCGDVDFLLDAEKGYGPAKDILSPLASSIGVEGTASKHFSMEMGTWEVELHGTLHCGLSRRMDRVLDDIQREMFAKSDFRVWRDGDVDVFLPAADRDVVFVFTHFIKHFYRGGVGLRQICDWCRLLWTFRGELDVPLLEKRLRAMGLISEWRAFAAYAVDFLGMPEHAMPLFSPTPRWRRKARLIHGFILRVGNFGHKRTRPPKEPYLMRKTRSFARLLADLAHHAAIFPIDSMRILPVATFGGIRSAMRGE